MYSHTPIITSNDCEGAGETFTVSVEGEDMPANQKHDMESSTEPNLFFRKKAFLTVSSQLHLEALATARTRVYTLSPCFRAERSQTNRHLAEFWMLEAEWAFTKEIGDVCAVVEDVVKEAVSSVVEEEGGEASDIQERVMKSLAPGQPWRTISYTDAISELQNAMRSPSSPTTFEYKPEWGQPLQSEHEKWLADAEGAPIFVTNYPRSLKPFYMRVNDDGRTVACFDLLIPGLGELVGGSLREERLPLLDQALEQHGLKDREEYGWYRELRKFGGVPHGGFGLGFERLVSIVSGQPNVRECIAMPRWAGRMLL